MRGSRAAALRWGSLITTTLAPTTAAATTTSASAAWRRRVRLKRRLVVVVPVNDPLAELPPLSSFHQRVVIESHQEYRWRRIFGVVLNKIARYFSASRRGDDIEIRYEMTTSPTSPGHSRKSFFTFDWLAAGLPRLALARKLSVFGEGSGQHIAFALVKPMSVSGVQILNFDVIITGQFLCALRRADRGSA